MRLPCHRLAFLCKIGADFGAGRYGHVNSSSMIIVHNNLVGAICNHLLGTWDQSVFYHKERSLICSGVKGFGRKA